MIYLILFLIPLLTLIWLGWVWWRLRRVGGTASQWMRWTCLGTVIVVLATYGWVVAQRMDLVVVAPHAWLQALLLMWAIVFLPFLALPMLVGVSLLDLGRAVTRRIFPTDSKSPDVIAEDPGMTRRQMLRTTALALPMLGTLGSTAISIPQKTRFRVRKLDVPIAGLPSALNGVTITHVSDTHVGKFTQGRVLKDLAETVNELKSELVLLTGDLIDHSVDDLPEALDMIESFNPGRGLFNVEGNHDLFDGAEAFAAGHAERGVPLLRAATARLRLNGHPLEIMGAAWTRRDADTRSQVAALADHSDPEAFRILLAHHPHAFDPAAEQGIPLTLAGHTHGGQLMVTPEIGPGPMMFRYWSGLYRKANSSLVVSNGAGNWFPLRTAAPAEVLQLTLRRV
ncbi:MAG: metallophosphoesterase [Luteolibacter sp.]